MENLTIINPGDKTRMFSVATGEGAPTAEDTLITDIISYPIGSEYLDTTNLVLYKRVAATGEISDWASATLTALS